MWWNVRPGALVQLLIKADYSDPRRRRGELGQGKQTFSGGQKAGESVQKGRPL